MPSDQDKDREDGLLRVASNALYLLIMLKQLEQLISAVGEDSIYAHLLKTLTAHNESWPYEAPKSAYEASQRSMPLLRVDPPLGTDDLDSLVQELGGYISPKFYRQVSTKDGAWRLFSLVSWCNPSNWTHDPSGTLIVRRYGVKWPVLILVFLRLNQLLIANPEKPLPESYKGVDIEFSQRDAQEIYIAAESLLAKLLESAELLQSSLGD
ncbi:hypothetical protein FRC07_003938 [Ceratobasidium sp. 392]|nr:hypothetical protein FRC07_003938 [Ceratobasidium sp. 392]